MAIPSDLDIARAALVKPIDGIAHELGIGEHLLEPYGESVVKVKLAAIDELADAPKAKYVVVTAITPTPLGEGKTTTRSSGCPDPRRSTGCDDSLVCARWPTRLSRGWVT